MSAKLFGDLESERQRIRGEAAGRLDAEAAEAAAVLKSVSEPSVIKVGPHGYIHGWIKVDENGHVSDKDAQSHVDELHGTVKNQMKNSASSPSSYGADDLKSAKKALKAGKRSAAAGHLLSAKSKATGIPHMAGHAERMGQLAHALMPPQDTRGQKPIVDSGPHKKQRFGEPYDTNNYHDAMLRHAGKEVPSIADGETRLFASLPDSAGGDVTIQRTGGYFTVTGGRGASPVTITTDPAAAARQAHGRWAAAQPGSGQRSLGE